jgi:transposase
VSTATFQGSFPGSTLNPNSPANLSASLPFINDFYHLNPPFYANDAKVDVNNLIVDIYISYDPKSLFSSPCCNVSGCKVHSKVPRVWRALGTNDYKVYLHLNLPRVRCPQCNKIVTYDVDWARKGCGVTYLFEKKTIEFCVNMPFAAVAKEIGESDKRIANIVNRAVDEARLKLDWSRVRFVGIDETSRAKGHKYITVFVDMETKTVLYATEGKDISVLDAFKNELLRNNGHPDNITEVAIDMSPAFISGVTNLFTNAKITFDKFHIVKMANEAIDKIRREESRQNPILKGSRYIWLHNPQNLSIAQQEKLKRLSKRNLKTAKAYRYKLTLQSIYNDIDNENDAKIELKRLISWGLKSKVDPLIQFAQTLQSHLNGILRYFQSGLTSGAVEGINSKIQEIKRRSRGFPNTGHFINLIYLVLGDLIIPVLCP